MEYIETDGFLFCADNRIFIKHFVFTHSRKMVLLKENIDIL